MELAHRRAVPSLVRASAQLGSVLIFAVLPAALVPLLLHAAGHDYLWDFRRAFLPAGHAILDGDSPYPHSLSALSSRGEYVYPPVVAVVMAPFALLPRVLAEGIFVALSLAAPALALWLLRVRDWRCYGVVYLWPPLLGGLSLGTISPLLAVPVAAAWRWRGSTGSLGTVLAGAAVTKLFLWPLVVLFAIGGRWRAALLTMLGATLVALASWALIGFAGLGDYPDLLQELSRLESPNAYGPTSLALSVGLPRDAALAFAIAVGAPLLVSAAVLLRRPGGHVAGLACALAATFALSPVVWLHYLVLLVVPVAAARNRLGLVWFVPLLFWLTPGTASSGSTWRIALVTAFVALTLVLAAAAARTSASSSPRPGDAAWPENRSGLRIQLTARSRSPR